MDGKKLGQEACLLLANIDFADLKALGGMSPEALALGFAELEAAGADFGERIVAAEDDELFRWMLLFAPQVKHSADHAWQLYEQAFRRPLPADRIVRLLPLLRCEGRPWQREALGIAHRHDRADVAAFLMPYCSDEDLAAGGADAWLRRHGTRPDGYAARTEGLAGRTLMAQRMLDALTEGNVGKLSVMLRNCGALYHYLPHERGEKPAMVMLRQALAAGEWRAAELIFSHTDLLRPEWVECLIAHSARSGDFLWMLEEPVFGGFRWEAWRHPLSGRSFLHLAAELGNDNFTTFWDQRGGELEPRDAEGVTPLDVARASGHHDFVATLEMRILRRDLYLPTPVPQESGKLDAPPTAASQPESAGLSIPVADDAEVMAFLERASVFDKDVSNRIRKAVATAFDDRGYQRTLGEVVAPETLAPLKESFPLFAGLIDEIQAQLSLLWRVAQTTGKPQALRLPNTLIVGKPGWGKTYFIHRLGEVLGLPFRPLQMSTMSAGFILAGTDPTWSTSRPGMIHELLTGGERMNPLILLDEIDKIASDSRHPADGPLFQLLEPEHARRFVDEFASYPIDASHINWFASANELAQAHPAIVSRFDVFEMPEPTPETARQTARSVYCESLQRSPWAVLFEAEPAEDVINVMAEMSPREAHRELKKAFGRASLAGREALLPDDFSSVRKPARRIGFVG